MRLFEPRGRWRWLRAGVAALVVALAAPAPALARSEKVLAYPREQAWPAAVRFLVVDEHVKITDKDADAGYVMFDLRDDGKLFHGSLELVSFVRDGQTVVRFVLHIVDRPSWLEIAMLRRLEDKLHAELGAPPPPPPPRPPKDDRPDDRKPAQRPDAPPPDAPRQDPTKPDDNPGPPISPTP